MKCVNKYRLYPTKAQTRQLDETLETCRLVYKIFVHWLTFEYETAERSAGGYEQETALTHWKHKVSDGKKEHPELSEVHAHLLQNVAHRVDLAFRAFFRRVRLRQAGAPGGNKPDAENEGQYLPNGASQKAGLNKSILDAAWTQSRSILTNKAESAGREVVAVNPRDTSQKCSKCGYQASKTLKERWHLCPMCGASLDRDTNAAVNILQLALG